MTISLNTHPARQQSRTGVRLDGVRAVLAALVMALFAMVASEALGQTPQPAQQTVQKSNAVKLLEDQFSAQRTAINTLKKELTEDGVTNERLTKIEASLRGHRDSLDAISEKMRGAWNINLKAIKDLGAAPKKDEPAEPEAIARQREILTKQQKRLDNLVRGSNVFATQASRLIETSIALKRERFFQQAFTRQRPPFSMFLWTQAANSFDDGVTRIWGKVSQWAEAGKKSGDLQLIAVFLSVALIIAGIVFRIIRQWLLPRIDRAFGGTADRVGHAGLRVVARIGPLALAGVILLAALRIENLLGATPAWFGWAILGALLIVPLATSVRRNVVANAIDIRGLPPAAVLAQPAGTIAWFVIAASVSIDILLRTISSLLGTSLYFAFAQSFVFAVLVAAMVMVLAWPAPGQKADGEKSRWLADFWPKVRIFLLAAAALTILAELVGYLAFGRFLIRTIVFLAMIAALFTLLRAGSKVLVQRAEAAFFGGAIQTDGAAERPHLMFAFWGGLLVDIVLLAIVAIVVLMNFHFSWGEIRDWLLIAFRGFEIGAAKISLIDIGTAIVVFLAFVAGTRFMQRFFRRELLPRTRLDGGVQDSLIRFTGYAGLLIATLSGFATLGIDFSNLAIIAGALSVGVGFGLQSIVNNFVSGLILLFERPIKVGDWIVTDSGEGNVRKIGVRSTIIETFDRTALIIPNSELVVSTVKNWTHNDQIGRHIIQVGVGYDTDPKELEAILYDCAKNDPAVLANPAPFVAFKDYGESSLDFELRIYLGNIRNVLTTATRLRFEIFARLKAAGIEIPFPQRDLHIKNVDQLEKAVAKPPKGRARK